MQMRELPYQRLRLNTGMSKYGRVSATILGSEPSVKFTPVWKSVHWNTKGQMILKAVQ